MSWGVVGRNNHGPLNVSPGPALEAWDGASPVGNQLFDINSTSPLRTLILSFTSIDKSYKMVSGRHFSV